MDPLVASMKVAASGLEAQSTRIRIVSENLANARSTGDTPGADPFRRKTVTFASELDRASGASTVEVERLGFDEGEFSTEYDPGNPAADAKGFVKMPNVNVLVEMADMREANRSYEANLQSIKQSRDLISATIAQRSGADGGPAARLAIQKRRFGFHEAIHVRRISDMETRQIDEVGRAAPVLPQHIGQDGESERELPFGLIGHRTVGLHADLPGTEQQPVGDTRRTIPVSFGNFVFRHSFTLFFKWLNLSIASHPNAA